MVSLNRFRYHFVNSVQGCYTLMLAILLIIVIGCGDDQKPAEETQGVEETLISISKVELDFGATEEQLTFQLINNSHQNVRWTAKADTRWISISPSEGGIDAWGKRNVTVKVNRALLQNWREYGAVTIDIPEYNERKEVSVSAQDPRLHPSDALLRKLAEAMMAGNLDAYLSVFWEEGYLFESTRGTKDTRDDRQIPTLELEKLYANLFFQHYEVISFKFTSVPDIDHRGDEAEVTVRYHIKLTQIPNKTPLESEGELEFTVKKHNNEWRIRRWKAKPDKRSGIFYKEF